MNDLDRTFTQIDEEFQLDEMMTQAEETWSAELFLKNQMNICLLLKYYVLLSQARCNIQ